VEEEEEERRRQGGKEVNKTSLEIFLTKSRQIEKHISFYMLLGFFPSAPQ
jgi:hypothetical protein